MVVESFPTRQLGLLCSKIGSGATPRGGSKVYLDQGEIALIRSQNVRNDLFDKNGLVFIKEKHAKQLANVAVERGDVLLNITGDSVARCSQVDPNVLPARVNQHVAIVRPAPDILDSRFLRYFLISPYMQNHMLGWAAAGATRNALTKGMIESFDVPVPDMPTQKAIAHVLGTLDDRIELNRRMNETLEAMAQALFKSWFVDFDPVIDNALALGKEIPKDLRERAAARAALGDKRKPLPEEIRTLFPDEFTLSDELGWIPEGWKNTTLKNGIELLDSKRIPLNKRQREEKKGDIPYYGAASIMDYVDDYLFDGIYILIGEDGTVQTDKGKPVVQYVWGRFWVNNHAHVCLGKNSISPEHLYLLLQEVNIVPFVTGAVQPKLNQKNLKSIPLLLAPPDVNDGFQGMVNGLFGKIRSNSDSINQLAKLRDTLLPKLLFGEVRIPDAEKMVEELA